MTPMLYNLIYVGPIVLVTSAITLPIFYLLYSRANEPKAPLSLPRYVLSAVVLGLVAFVIGTILGIAAACLPADAGNLCGLVRIFGLGPLIAGLVLLAFGYLRTQAARTGTNNSFKGNAPNESVPLT
jgi:hypothetical protein